MRLFRKLSPAFARFLAVGLSGTLINLSMLWALVATGFARLPASAIATEVAIINNFIWNDRWTFRQQATGGWLSFFSRFGRFQGITLLTTALTVGLFFFFNTVAEWPYMLAQLAAIGVATIVNYVTNSRFTWKARPQPQIALPAEVRVEPGPGSRYVQGRWQSELD